MRHILFIIIATAACNETPMTEEFCKRADSCNILGPTSVEECTEDLDAALERLPPSQRDEVEYEVQICLDRPSCAGFRACVDSWD